MPAAQNADLKVDCEMIDLGQFARKMGVCSNTVRNWISDGKLVEGEHYFHLGRIYRFPWGADYVARLMKSLAPAPQPTRPRLQSRKGNRSRLKLQA